VSVLRRIVAGGAVLVGIGRKVKLVPLPVAGAGMIFRGEGAGFMSWVGDAIDDISFSFNLESKKLKESKQASKKGVWVGGEGCGSVL
jgi:hypothetical protein